MLDIETADTMPAVRRSAARPSEERKQIQSALQTGTVQVIKNVEAGNKYNALQQRIRQAAQSMGLKVKIVNNRHDNDATIGDLYFHGYTAEDSEA